MKKFAILLALLLTLCGVKSLAENSSLVTRDDLILLYGLPDNEFLDDFMAEFSPTIEYLEGVDIEQVFLNYLLRKYSEINDCNYLLSVSRSSNENISDTSNIDKILWFWNPDGMIRVKLFDFSAKKLYDGDYNFLSDIQKANSRSLKDEELNVIVDSLEQYQLTKWEETYSSSINRTTGYLYWRVVIEYNDGTHFVSEGSGSDADNLPPTYSNVLDLLQYK